MTECMGVLNMLSYNAYPLNLLVNTHHLSCWLLLRV